MTAGHFTFDFGDDQIINLADQTDYRFPHPIQRWVVPVLPMHQSPVDAGSAFLVAPGVAITATHVVMDKAIQEGRVDETQFVAVFVSAEYSSDTDAFGGPLDITQVASSPDHDLAVITLRWPEVNGATMRHGAAPLSAQLPVVGESVLALGYTQIEASPIGNDGISLNQVVTATKGTIEEVLPDGRGDFIISYPVARGDFPAPGALSGGPVISSRTGKVFGAVTRSMAPFEEQTRWTSYVSLLNPVFDLPFGAIVDGVERDFTIRELAHLGIVPSDGSL